MYSWNSFLAFFNKTLQSGDKPEYATPIYLLKLFIFENEVLSTNIEFKFFSHANITPSFVFIAKVVSPLLMRLWRNLLGLKYHRWKK